MKKFIAGLLLSSALAAPAFAQVPQQCVTNALAGGTSDAITVPLLPCGLATNILILTISANNTTTTPTLQMAGFPALPILTNTLAAPGIGDFGDAGTVLMLTSTGSSWLIINGNVGGFIPLPLTVANGGTGDTTLASHGVLFGNGTSAIGATAAGTTGQVLIGNTGSAPTWASLTGIGVTSLSFGSTGLTPNSSTTGAITVGGTLATGAGGTGLTGYTTGDMIYASGASALAKLAAAASGNLLHSGTAPSWGKVDLTAEVIGLLPIGSGGTGSSSFTTNGLLTGGATIGSTGAGTTGQLLVGVTGSAPVWTTTPPSGVTSISFGATGLTPSSPTGAVVTVGGTLGVGFGGTGQSSYTNGQLLIGNTTGNTLTKTTLTAGANVSITNGTGSITIASSSPGALILVDGQTGSFNATAGNQYCVDTSGGVAIATLPATPGLGDTIGFMDCAGTFGTHNLTLAHNGNSLINLAQDMTVNQSYIPIKLVWSVAKTSWIFAP